MSTPKTKPAPTRSAKGKAPVAQWVQITLPKPLPRGVSVVYEKNYDAFFFQTSGVKAMSALLDAVWASTKT